MQSRLPEDKFITINGLRLHYLDWGGNAERVLLFAHGQGGNAHSFDHLAPELRDEFRILALDQRGHGDSDHTWEGYSVKLFAADFAAFAEALHTPYDLVGASLGARNAIPYAGDHSDHLRHLVLLDFGPEQSVEQAQAAIARQAEARPRGWRSIEDYVSWQLEQNPRANPEAVRRAAPHSLRLNYAHRYVLKADPELFWINGGFGAAEVPYLWEQWAKIRCPILVMQGTRDSRLSTAITDRMQDMQPGMRLVMVPNSGHGITADNPAFLIQQLRLFLNEPVPQAAR